MPKSSSLHHRADRACGVFGLQFKDRVIIDVI